MKVNTVLKSGLLVTDASNLVNQAKTAVVDFFSTGQQQAHTVTSSVAGTVQSAWNNLTGWIKLG